MIERMRMTRRILAIGVVGLALLASACEDVGDQDGNGKPDEPNDYIVYCSTHPEEARCVPPGGGGGCVDCVEHPGIDGGQP